MLFKEKGHDVKRWKDGTMIFPQTFFWLKNYFLYCRQISKVHRKPEEINKKYFNIKSDIVQYFQISVFLYVQNFIIDATYSKYNTVIEWIRAIFIISAKIKQTKDGCNQTLSKEHRRRHTSWAITYTQ